MTAVWTVTSCSVIRRARRGEEGGWDGYVGFGRDQAHGVVDIVLNGDGRIPHARCPTLRPMDMPRNWFPGPRGVFFFTPITPFIPNQVCRVVLFDRIVSLLFSHHRLRRTAERVVDRSLTGSVIEIGCFCFILVHPSHPERRQTPIREHNRTHESTADRLRHHCTFCQYCGNQDLWSPWITLRSLVEHGVGKRQ